MLKNCPCYNTMEENPIILDYSHKKLDEVPQEILDNGRMLEELNLDSNNIELLPKGIFNLPKLRILSVSDNNLCELSMFLGNLDCVESLDVSKNCISELPDSIENCTQLLQLDASVNPIVKLPDRLFSSLSLTHLILNETFLECLPENMGKLSQLKVLELRQNQLSILPKSMQNLRQLERLDIGNNKFTDLPVAIGYMTNLEELLADGNVIEEIPPVIGFLENLILLDISMNKLETLPPEIESMKSLTDLYLSENELLELPENIGSLSSLETLKLDENDLLFLPPSIGRLENLEELDVNTNNLEGLPYSMGQLTKLKVLNLDNNCIKSLPDELGSCSSLSLLSLHSNNLVCVPESFGQLHSLQMINLSANMLNFLPVTFLDLKNLKALWLCENQSKPVVPLVRVFDEKERKDVVRCFLLPQKTWDEDDSEHPDGSEEENISNSSIVNEDEVDNVDVLENEAVRTRGSISQCLVNRNKSEDDHVTSPGNEVDHVTPWYEQEFIENVDDNEVFSDEHTDENAAEEGSYNLRHSTIEEILNSQHSFREEQSSSIQLIDASSSMSPSCRDIHRDNVTSSGNIDTNETIHSFNEGPNDSSLFTIAQESALKLSDAGGALEENRKGELSLVDAEGRSRNDGNTSVTISDLVSPEYFDEENIDKTEQSLALNTSDEEEMRLRFNNKRNRNGNPSCTYEAFKPTRFNLYTNSDEPSWSTIKKDNSLESASPTIKKKSVTAKLNPLIGARLARDGSPPAVRYSGGAENQKYTVTQKYEDKIRALQQQRQKERSRRRNHSARGAENLDLTFRSGENLDLTFSPDMHPPSYAEFYKYQSNPTASLPAPSYYLISDDGDSVAIQLNDFVLGSPRVKNEKKKKGKDKSKHKASSPPVDRHNGLYQQHASNYLYNTDNGPHKQNGILQNLESHKRILQSYTNGHYESSSGSKSKEQVHSYHNNGDYSDNRANHKQSYKHETIHIDHDFVFTPGRGSEQARVENSERSSNSPRTELLNNRASSPYPGTYAGQVENSLNKSRTTDRQFGKRLQPNGSIQHVTVKSGQISRPLSPRLVMAETKDVTFQQFSPICRNEDVASFLVQNIENDMSTRKERTSVVRERSEISRPPHQSVVHERVSRDCDDADVARNISKHLVEFCKVDNVESHKEIELFVTDLDAPDAASPLSRNGQRDVMRNGDKGKGKRFQVVKLSSGPTEEVEVRVYRNPALGFTIGGGTNSGSQVEGIYVVSVNPGGPSSHLLRSGDRILEVNEMNLRSVSHELAVLFLTHNQQLDLLIERVVQ